MYQYCGKRAGHPAAYAGFGTKMTLRPEDRLRMEREQRDPTVMIPRLEAQLAQQEKQLAEAIALDPSIPYRERNIAAFTAQIASTKRQLAAFRRQQTGGTVAVQTSARLPAWVWPAALTASAFFLWRLAR